MKYLQFMKNKKMVAGLSFVFLGSITILFSLFYRERFVPYNIQERIIHKEVQGKRKYFIYGTFSIKSQCFLNPTTKGMYIIPAKSNGQTSKEIKNILFYAPFNGEDGSMAYDRYEWLRTFAEQYDFAIFSLRIKADTDHTNDTSKYYIYKEAGWFSGIFKIQQFLQEKFNLKKCNLFAIGQSSGCSMIQRMAVEMPEKFTAVAGHGGSRFASYTQNQTFPPFIFSSTSGDTLNIKNRENYEAASKANIKVWYMETVPTNDKDLHSASDHVFKVLTAFILSVANIDSKQTKFFTDEFEKMPVFLYPKGKN